jgi:hypothetical protein
VAILQDGNIVAEIYIGTVTRNIRVIVLTSKTKGKLKVVLSGLKPSNINLI